MPNERTLGIVKPDAVARGVIGAIIGMIERAGLRIIGMRMVRLGDAQVRDFYAVHRDQPFFQGLVELMTSGPCVVMAIEGENVIARYRELMGPTDSRKASPGTIRREFGTDNRFNAVHGSDGPQTAKIELGQFFAEGDLV